MIDIIIHFRVDYRVVSTFYQAKSRLVEACGHRQWGQGLGWEGRLALEANYKSCFTAFL